MAEHKLKGLNGKTLSLTNIGSLSKDKNVIYLDDVTDFTVATSSDLKVGSIAHVSGERGGTFEFIGDTSVHDDGVNFHGWKRQYDGAVNVKWFGAKGDGVTDDLPSILACFKSQHTLNVNITFENKTYAITPETLEVGGNTSRSQFFYTLLELTNKKSILIDFNGCAINYIGSFSYGHDTVTGVPMTPGGFLSITNSTNVVVKNLIVDGIFKDTNTITLLDTGADIRQIGGVGLYIKGNTHVTLDNINIKNMQFDGFYLAGDNILVNDCQAENCNRQGITIAGGDNILLHKSTFKDTGKWFINNNESPSTPGSCIDIETEYSSINNLVIKNSNFINGAIKEVEFYEAAGNSVNNILFDSCLFDGEEGFASIPTECKILNSVVSTKIFNFQGISVRGQVGHNTGKFSNCQFVTGHPDLIFKSAWFQGGTVTKGLFEKCSFTSYLESVVNNMPGSLDSAYTTFDSCIFKSDSATTSPLFRGQFTGETYIYFNGQSIYSSPTRSMYFKYKDNNGANIIDETPDNTTVNTDAYSRIYNQMFIKSSENTTAIRVNDDYYSGNSSIIRKNAISYFARKDGAVSTANALETDGSTASIVFTDRPGVSNYVRTSDIEFWTGQPSGYSRIPTKRFVIDGYGKIFMYNLPTDDPNEEGQIWNNSGTLSISEG